MGLCPAGAKGNQRVMMVYPEKVLYLFCNDQELDEIIQAHFIRNKISEKHLTHTDFFAENFSTDYYLPPVTRSITVERSSTVCFFREIHSKRR